MVVRRDIQTVLVAFMLKEQKIAMVFACCGQQR
jgi:hypothetical protein